MTLNDAASRGVYEQLQTGLVASADTAFPASTAVPMIEVVAPATLQEGYTFEAQIGEKGRTFTVTVPPGGVEDGQKFSVPIPGSRGEEVIENALVQARVSVPVGDWKDGQCNFCGYGMRHPVFWNALFCPTILTAQIMSRLKLTWQGEPGDVAQTAQTFRIIFYIVAIEVFLLRIMPMLIPSTFFQEATYDPDGIPNTGDEREFWMAKPEYRNMLHFFGWIRVIVHFCTAAFTLYLMTKTRAYMRSKYGIPEKNCPGCEDLCCSLWCYCCTVAQMARHTADYDTYRGVCCSDTGMPDHVPAIA